MPQYQTVEVPFKTIGNHQVLTGLQMVEQPWLREFVEAFPDCFEYAPNGDYVVYYPDGK